MHVKYWKSPNLNPRKPFGSCSSSNFVNVERLGKSQLLVNPPAPDAAGIIRHALLKKQQLLAGMCYQALQVTLGDFSMEAVAETMHGALYFT